MNKNNLVVIRSIIQVLMVILCLGCDKEINDPLTAEERTWLEKHDGKIRLSSDPFWGPIAFFDENGIKKGIAPDYMKLIENKLGFKFKRVPFYAWNKVINAAKEKRIDAISAANRNPERSKYLNFSKVYLEIRTAIIVRKEIKKTLSLEEMGGMKVSLTEGSALHDFIRNNYVDINVVPVSDDIKSLKMLASGEIDAVFADIATVSYIVQKNNMANLRVAGYSPFKYTIRIATRKDWPILNRIIEKGLASINQREREDIKNRWISMGKEEAPTWVESPMGIAIVLFISILLLVLLRIGFSRLKGRIIRGGEKRKIGWIATATIIYFIVVAILLLIFPGHFFFIDPLTPEERTWLDKNDGKIRFATSDGYPPFDFLDKNGAYLGLSADYIRLIEQKLNFKFKMVFLKNWDEIVEKARKNEIDVISSMQKTPERSEYLLFTESYIDVTSVIIVRKEVIKSLSLEKMTGMKIAVVKNYAVIDFLEKNYSHLGFYQVFDPLSGLIDVSFNSADAMVIDLPVASYYIAKEGITNLRMAGKTGYIENLRFASRKDWPILNSILQKGLSHITQDERDEIFQKWVHLESIPFYMKRSFGIIAGVSAFAVLFLILIMLAWNRSLKVKVRERTTALNQQLEIQKQIEEDLRQSREQFKTIVSNIPGATYRCAFDSNWTMEYISDGIEDIIGYPYSDFLGNRVRSYASIIHPDDAGMVEDIVSERISNKEPYTKEYRIIHFDGSVRYVWERGRGVFGNKGELVCLDGTVFDITERKNAESALEESHRRLTTILDSLDSLVYVADMKTYEIEFINKYGRDIWGDIVGKICWQTLQSGQTGPCDFCSNKYLLDANGKPTGAYEWEFQNTVNGRWYNIHDQAIFWTDSRIVKMEIALDITNSKQTEEELKRYRDHLKELVSIRTRDLEKKALELEEANLSLKESDRLKTVFLSSVSHELRTPLNAIIGFTGIILQGMVGEISEEQEKQLIMVKNSGEDLLGLVQDVLDIAEIEAGRGELSVEEIMIKDVITEVEESFSQEVEEKGLELTWDVPQGVSLQSDRRRLKQALMNLVSNAVKFTDSGSIILKAGVSGDKNLEMSVIDTGIGIREADMDSLFQPFHQLDLSHKKRHEGSGLGLYLTKKLADLLGGNVSAKSELGKGSEFTFILPLRHSGLS